MNRLQYAKARVDQFFWAYFDSRRDDRISDNWRIALNFGTTLPLRFFLALHSIILGGQVELGQSSMFTHAAYQTFFGAYSHHFWSGLLLSSGLLMLWRVFSPNGHFLAGFISNALASAIWGAVVCSRLFVVGPIGILGSGTVVWLMALLCLVRSGATRRDVETA
jgi:hypothetical protein